MNPKPVDEPCPILGVVVLCGVSFLVGAMVAFLIILAGASSQFVTDQYCDNQTEMAYSQGVYDLLMEQINTTRDCEKPWSYLYTGGRIDFIPLRCLNLNTTKEEK